MPGHTILGHRPSLRALRAVALGALLLPCAAVAAGEPASLPVLAAAPSTGAAGPAEVVSAGTARARLAELLLELAAEARLGGSSSLFSQVSASSAADLSPASRRRGATSTDAGPEAGRRSGNDPPARPPTSGSSATVVDPGRAERPAARAAAGNIPGGGEEVEVVLEAGRVEEDAARLARESGLEVTETHRSEDGALVATMRTPLVADADRTRQALRELESSPEIVELRSPAGDPLDLGPADEIESEEAVGVTGEDASAELSEADLLARELLGEDLLEPAPIETRVPWRFVLGMLASLGLLGIAGLLWWSAERDGRESA